MHAHVWPRPLPHAGLRNNDASRPFRRACTFIRRTACGMAGHDYLQRSSGNRIFLRCTDCGDETPGWQIDIRFGRRRSS
jgi:hypothetical protein